MSYHIYNTRGFILSSRPIREADRIYSILTRELGLVRARALGVRKLSSKLRGNIEPFSIVNLSLIKGKEHWRLTSAEFVAAIPVVPEVARPISLLEKLVTGEEAAPLLFDSMEELLLNPSSQEESFEVELTATILFHLGYLKETDMNLDKKSLIKAINDGIQASQL